MINLIPPKAKKSILIEYWVRVSSVWLTSWAIALFASASILLPTYVLIGSQVSIYETSAAEASEKVANYNNVSTALVQASQQARLILDESEIPVFSDYIRLVEELQGPDIQISEIKLSRGEEGVSPIILVGVAKDRHTLASFRDRLLASEQIGIVDLPISNLASDSDINFDITVTLNNETSV